MKLLVDTNIVLDLLLRRHPWWSDAATLLSAGEERRVDAYVASHTITTVHYLVAKAADRHTAAAAVADVLRITGVVEVGEADFHRALVLGLNDFEDAVQVAAALRIGANFLVTRNERDFIGSTVPIRSPGAILALL